MPSDDIKRVEPRDTSKPNSLIVALEGSVFSSKGAVCYWNGQAYPPGSKVCSEDLPARRTLYICQANGTWLPLGDG